MAVVPHTLSEFDDGLQNIRQTVLLMASEASRNVEDAVSGLLNQDGDLCNQAIANDDAVNEYERTIDETGVEVMIRFNPLAGDLRTIVGGMKISNNLERISDEAESIARRANKSIKRAEIAERQWIQPASELAKSILADAIRAYSEGDEALALTLYERDKELDTLHRKLIKRFTKAMEANPDNLRGFLNLIFVTRCLERIGDHAVNIGEEVVYILSAQDIRHVGPGSND